MLEKERYMQRCLFLAQMSKGKTSPNPMVGAVIVHNGRIIGEGWHKQCGQAHAEVNAIASVKDQSLLSESTLYVNLEPCSHYGKTPPCTQLIIEKKIPHVVIGTLDPFPEVSGRGADMLRKAGVKVETDICVTDCEALNRRFLTFQRQHRPYIILKWAQSADGFISGENEKVVLSSPLTQLLVHRMRAEEDAVLVGTNTACIDNPRLDNRLWPGKSPLRLVIDRTLRIPSEHHLLDGTHKTIVFTEKKSPDKQNVIYIQLNFEKNIWPQIFTVLVEKNIQSLIVEGGREILQNLLDQKLYDEIRIEATPKILNSGIEAPRTQLKIKKRLNIMGHSLTISD